MMRSCSLALLIVLGAAPALHAQTPQPGLPSMAAVEEARQMAQQMLNPAAFSLEHRTDLQLTESQVAALEPASARLSEVQRTTMERMQEIMRQLPSPASGGQTALDEGAIRTLYRAKAEVEADLMIQILQTQRLVAQTLGSEQQAKLRQLQMAAAIEMFQHLPSAQRR